MGEPEETIEDVEEDIEEQEIEEEPEIQEEDSDEEGELEEEAEETEEEEEEEEPQEEIEEQEERIPIKRFKKVYGKAKQLEREKEETQRKYDLLKRDPKRFYELYPEERPQRDAQPQAQPDIRQMVVQGGPYDGKTLGDVYDIDPAIATQIQYNYLRGIEEQQAETKRQAEEQTTRYQQQAGEFAITYAKDVFGKDVTNLNDLSEKEFDQIKDELSELDDWAVKTGRTNLSPSDLYALKNYDQLRKTGKMQASKAAASKLKGTPSISSGKGAGQASGYDAYIDMSPDKFQAVLESMSDAKYREFIKKAPRALRVKYPSFDWSD